MGKLARSLLWTKPSVRLKTKRFQHAPVKKTTAEVSGRNPGVILGKYSCKPRCMCALSSQVVFSVHFRVCQIFFPLCIRESKKQSLRFKSINKSKVSELVVTICTFQNCFFMQITLLGDKIQCKLGVWVIFIWETLFCKCSSKNKNDAAFHFNSRYKILINLPKLSKN